MNGKKAKKLRKIANHLAEKNGWNFDIVYGKMKVISKNKKIS